MCGHPNAKPSTYVLERMAEGSMTQIVHQSGRQGELCVACDESRLGQMTANDLHQQTGRVEDTDAMCETRVSSHPDIRNPKILAA